MGKNFRYFWILPFLFILIWPGSVNADYRSRILGASTTSNLSIPATVEGPGLILPDSPLFFLDELKQNVRILTSVNPVSKAKVYSDIAGERMAELRFMLSRNNQEGIKTSIEGVSYNFKKSAEELKRARLMGRNVAKISKAINTSIKEKQVTLDVLESQSQGEVKARVALTQEALIAAKIEVDEGLSKDDLENEIKDDLRRIALRKFNQISNYSKELEKDLEELNIQASQAATKSLKQRQESLSLAIAEKNNELKRANEQLLEAEKKKQASYSASTAEIEKIVREAQEVAAKFEKSTEVLNEKVEPTPTPTP